MDYTQASTSFKLRKVFRYIRLYGLSRTFAKVKGQYHMNTTETFEEDRWENPKCSSPNDARRGVAIIGCGNFAYAIIAYYLKKRNKKFLKYTFDTNSSRSLSLCRAYGGAFAVKHWEEILHDDDIRLVFISSNHASHATYASKCIAAGKSVHIEKPHAVNEEQLSMLYETILANPEPNVMLGFNRPRSPLVNKLKYMLDEQNGPLMINWFVAGHEIPNAHWYFDEKEGGRVLGNLCHWSDITLKLISTENAFPCVITTVAPKNTKSDYIISIVFNDNSCASITFSAKGHTFEGVREVLNVQRGDLLASLRDFKILEIEVLDKKYKQHLKYRDHGHKNNIYNSIDVVQEGKRGESIEYIHATGKFILAIRRAFETNESILLTEKEAFGTA